MYIYYYNIPYHASGLPIEKLHFLRITAYYYLELATTKNNLPEHVRAEKLSQSLDLFTRSYFRFKDAEPKTANAVYSAAYSAVIYVLYGDAPLAKEWLDRAEAATEVLQEDLLFTYVETAKEKFENSPVGKGVGVGKFVLSMTLLLPVLCVVEKVADNYFNNHPDYLEEVEDLKYRKEEAKQLCSVIVELRGTLLQGVDLAKELPSSEANG